MPPATNGPNDDRTTGDNQGLHVLVVEDDADCAESTAILLRLYGHSVETARDCPTALQAVERRDPDVVLLDIGLPGVNGWDLAEKIAEQARRKPLLIAVSGYVQEADRQH